MPEDATGKAEGPPDPYEYGFDVAQRRRMPLPELPAEPKRARFGPPRDAWKFAIAGLAIVVIFAVGRGVQAERANSLKPDCARDQVRTSETSVATRSGLVHWSATGPRGTRYVVTFNASAVSVAGDVATATPAVGAAGQASRVQTMPGKCLGRGVIGVLLPPGTYPVTMFRLDDAGSATEVAHTTLKVTPQ